MTTKCELATRDTIHAYRHEGKLLIVAEGKLPSPGYDVEITQRPERIFPSWYQVLRCERPGIVPAVIVPYRVSATVDYPQDRPTVRVFHADGDDDVTIEACGDALAGFVEVLGDTSDDRACPEGADEATGVSKKLSFDEAFANAIANLPAIAGGHADMLETVRVVEISALFGGIAGFHDLHVRVCRTHD